MENQFKTSFIPKKPIETSADLSSHSSGSHHVGRTLFSLFGLIIFLASVGGYAATYVWEMQLQRTVSTQIENLKKAKNQFDENFILEASRLDTRITESSKILKNHVSPSRLYALFEEYTRQTVSFDQFNFADNTDGTLSVSGTGRAVRYESIVLQSDSFGRSGYMRDVIFTNTQRDTANQDITFSFSATLDPRLILYSKRLDDVNTQN